MNIVISGKHIELTDALKSFAKEKFSKLETFFEHILRIDVTLHVEDTKAKEERCSCDVAVSANGQVLRAREVAIDLYAAIDLCLEKMERQIKKYNEKLKARGKTSHPEYKVTHSIISTDNQAKEGEPRTPPKIVKSNKFALKPMHVDEAAMQLSLLDQDFVVFSNADTNEVNVVYRMSGGSVGLIEPHFNN